MPGTADDPLIATHLFTTAGLPEPAQFPTWAGFTAHSRITRPAHDGPFAAEAQFWLLEGAVVSTQIVDPFAMDRHAGLVATTAASHAWLVLFRDGRSRFTAPGIDQDCLPGDIVFCDLNRPGRCDNLMRQRTIAVAMAVPWLEAATGPVAVHGRLPRTGETRLLTDFLVSLVDRLPQVRPSTLPRLSRILRDMVANAVTAADPGHDAAGPSSGLARARAYVLAQPPGTLDPGRMAATLGLTRSALYRLFRSDGGVMAWDRARRLRLLHRAIADPDDARRLSQMGHDLGFLDPAQLARRFRAAFGYSMTDLRRMRAVIPAPDDRGTAAMAAARYKGAVGGLA